MNRWRIRLQERRFTFKVGDKVVHRLEGDTGIVLGAGTEGRVIVQFRREKKELPCVMIERASIEPEAVVLVIFLILAAVLVVCLVVWVIAQAAKLM